MNIELDKELINRCNNQSMYNRGSHIQDDANLEYKQFLEKYKDQKLNSSQLEILSKRKEQFKGLLTDVYNEYLRINAGFVPITVAGPSNYPSSKMDKIMGSMNQSFKNMEDKINKFYKNTDDMLNKAYSKDEILSKYRNGYNEPISSDDPLAKEKLEAKLEYLKEKHNSYKEFNKKARQSGTDQLPSYVLANSNQNIKSVEDRLKTLERMNNIENGGYYFDGGEVKFDKEDMRAKIFFDEKPDEKTRNDLKSHGYKWSPKNMAWQRKLTPDAIYMTKNLFKDIGSLEIKLVADYTKTM